MRLIDADAFKAYMRGALEQTRRCYPDGGEWAEAVTEEFCRDIDEQPTVQPVNMDETPVKNASNSTSLGSGEGKLDLISRRAAIDALDCINGVEEVLRSLPSAQPEVLACGEGELIAQPDTDTISRKAAIDAVEFGITYARAINTCTGETKELFKVSNHALKEASERIKELPSAQPEIIRCKDCDWWTKQEDSVQGRCELMQMYPTGGWYCGNAKRRTSRKESEGVT